MNGITAPSKVALQDFQHPVAPAYPVEFLSSAWSRSRRTGQDVRDEQDDSTKQSGLLGFQHPVAPVYPVEFLSSVWSRSKKDWTGCSARALLPFIR